VQNREGIVYRDALQERLPRPKFKMPRAGKYPAELPGFEKLSRGKQKQLISLWRQRKANEERIAAWKAAMKQQTARTWELSRKFAKYRAHSEDKQADQHETTPRKLSDNALETTGNGLTETHIYDREDA
jgi:hypothetical protein